VRGPDPDSFVREFGAPYCNLHRADLHSALTDAVTKNDPDAILLGHRFDHLEQDGDKVIARFSNRTSFEAPALIGADGGAPAVRTMLGDAARYELARRDRANGVQLAARYQGTQHHGSTASSPNSGKTAVALGLFSYNPVTEPM
jgi:2-polyprenyl-6-methoxyphenol hydroxylase-like FAD-dependent oxidoreductase